MDSVQNLQQKEDAFSLYLRARAEWNFRTPASIRKAIRKLGYKSSSLDKASEFESAERNQLLLKMGIALFLMMNVMYLSYVLYVGYFQDLAEEMRRLVPLLLLALTIPSVFWCGLPIHRKAFRSLTAWAPTMEVLFSISIFAAFFYSIYQVIIGDDHVYFDTAVSLVALFHLAAFCAEFSNVEMRLVIDKDPGIPDPVDKRHQVVLLAVLYFRAV